VNGAVENTARPRLHSQNIGGRRGEFYRSKCAAYNRGAEYPRLKEQVTMPEEIAINSSPKTSRRGFIDLLLGATFLGWIATVAYPIVRYLTPLPHTGPTGPTRLTREDMAKLEAKKFVIVPVSGKRVIVLQSGDDILAFNALCTHEGCTVTFVPGQSVVWCPCHDARFDLSGRVLSGPPPRPLEKYFAQRQPDGGIVVSLQSAWASTINSLAGSEAGWIGVIN
jgi:cytochrome b6-f complex iron-sulfur subunit